jgi:hypothetical protein
MEATQYRAVCDGWTDAQASGPFGAEHLAGLRQHVLLLDALEKRNARVERRVVTEDGATEWEVVEDVDDARDGAYAEE